MRIEPLNLAEARYAEMQRNRRPPVRASFEAGKVNRLTFDWAFRILSFNQELGLDLSKIVGRSRELANDDTTMTKFLRAVEKNVIGPDGIKLQSKVMLQRGGRPNELINSIIEGAWRDWGKKGNCSLDGRLSWVQMQRIVARTMAIDGECFVLKEPTPYGIGLLVINSDRIDRNYGRNAPLELPNGNFVFMGVECDPNGKPVAYNVFTRHPSEAGSGPRQRVRIPADRILHIYFPVRDNQYRGLPWATPAMFRLNMLKGYIEAEVVAARVAACQMGFIQKDLDPNPAYSGDAPTVDYTGGQTFEAEAGTFASLAPGESIAQFKPEHPTTAFDPFVKSAKLDIAAGLDVSYMNLSGDVGAANYSSARVGLLDERDTWESLQGFFIEEFCQPVFSAWVQMAFLTLGLPGGDWRVYDKAEWHPRSFPWVDPYKDAQAEVMKLQNGFTTRHQILAKQGYDFDEVMAELAEEEQAIKDAGLDHLILGATATRVSEAATADGTTPPAGNQSQGSGGMGKGLLTDLVMLANKRK